MSLGVFVESLIKTDQTNWAAELPHIQMHIDTYIHTYIQTSQHIQSK